MSTFWKLCLLTMAGIATAWSQETRGAIFGRTTDPQGSAVPDVSVTVTNTGTNTSVVLKTNNTGYYEAGLLVAGTYTVSAEATGFKKSVRSDVPVQLGSRVELDIALEVGGTSETVNVTGEAPLIDTASNATAGRVMSTKEVLDLPTFNNSPLMLIKLAPGIESSNNRRYNGVNALGGTAEAHNVGNVGGNDWSIDGVPNIGNGYSAAYLPYATTIQEYKVETANFDASVGHTSGAAIAIMTKAGTNSYHGDLTWQFWNQRWNGTRFFVKQAYFRSIADAEASGNHALAQQLRNSPQQPSGHSNDYAASLGGPILRNKLFFFFSFDGFDDRKPTENTFNHTVPTLPERQGDFSDLLAVNASKYQLYDPLTVRADPNRPGHYIRDPFAGNIIPKSRMINPTYDTYLGFFPKPNNSPVNPSQEPLNNYVGPGEPYNWFYEAFANRFDYQHSEKHRFFGRWSWLKYREDRQDWTYETARGLMTNGVNRNNLGTTANWVYTPTASTVVDVGLGVMHFQEGNILKEKALSYTPSSVGLPAYMDAKAGVSHALPIMTFMSGSYDTLGQSVPNWTHFENASVKGNLSYITGSHTLRAGVDVREHRRNGGNPGITSGQFSFTNAFTCKEDDCLTAGSLGHSWASYLLGLPATSSVDTNATFALSNPYAGVYGQDSWRISRKLTVTFGLRMEYEFGMKERYDRFIGGFDPTATLPITNAAQAAYAQRPIPELPASQFSVVGGSFYNGVGGRDQRYPPGQLMWLPRFGAAFQISPKLVIRGGYGVYYDTLNAQNFSPDQSGFSRTTTNQSSTDFGQTWLSGNPAAGISPLADPFPIRTDGTRFDLPAGSALGLLAKTGSGWTFYDPNFRRPREQRWRVDVQRQIGPSMTVSAAYAGMYASDLRINRRLDALPGQYWATGSTRNDAIATNLNGNVPNPFNISNFSDLAMSNATLYQALASRSFFTSTTIRKNQLLRPFPEMNGVTSTGPYGSVKGHSVEAVFQKRFSRGLILNGSYTGLYERDRDYYLNEFDSTPSWEETNNGVPHRFTATGIYELPFGRGKPLARSGVLNMLFGGWQIAGAYEVQPGPLINWPNVFYNGNPANVCSGTRTLDQWFDTSGFVRSPAQQPAAFQSRVFPVRIGGCRADGLNRLDSNIQRTFKIRERIGFQLRLDALNVANHTQFDVPNTDPTSTNFGRVTNNTSSTMRFLLIQGRIQF